MSDITETIEEARAKATELGCVVVEGGPDRLLLDLDTPEAVAQFERLRRKVDELYGIQSVERWASKSGNTHVQVNLTVGIWSAAERVALQAALGSDAMRELLAVRRLHLGVAEPSLLFQPAFAEITVEPWGVPPVPQPAPIPSGIDDEWPF